MTSLPLRDWLALHLYLQAHPSARRALPADAEQLKSLKTMTLNGLIERHRLHGCRGVDIFRADYPEWADKEIEACRESGVTLVTSDGPGYPPGLLRLGDPPLILYMRGNIRPADAVSVAVVGSRRLTPYGQKVATRIGRELSEAGVTVVSGLARGVDSAAHQGALAGGGRTLAVLGSGLNRLYPEENRKLAGRVAASGAVISEYPLDTAPLAHHFPVRNRILAALSEGVVVVEAARDSGSLITAGLALDLGIFVGAVPGSILSPTSIGCNDLIHSGATPVRGLDDILQGLPSRVRELLPARAGRAGSTPASSDDQGRGLGATDRRVLEALSPTEGQSAGDLAQSLQLASGVLLGHLLELEIRGLAVRSPGDLFLRK